jgi:hypothetical protein
VLPSQAVQKAADCVNLATEILSDMLEESDEDGSFAADVYAIYNRLLSVKDDLEDLID